MVRQASIPNYKFWKNPYEKLVHFAEDDVAQCQGYFADIVPVAAQFTSSIVEEMARMKEKAKGDMNTQHNDEYERYHCQNMRIWSGGKQAAAFDRTHDSDKEDQRDNSGPQNEHKPM